MLDKILNLIYPPVCGVCGRLDKNSLCKKCEMNLANQAVFGVDDYSQDKEKFFDEHLYIFAYSGIIRKVLLNYKFGDKSYLYKTFINFLIKNEKFVAIIKSYDIIIAVPLNRKREKQRGYNQSGLIATEISNLLKVELMQNSLQKVQNVVAQSGLNKEQRQENIKCAYVLKNAQYLQGKSILILDDIYTTGSTVNECSKLLKNAGTKKIGVLTIAKD